MTLKEQIKYHIARGDTEKAFEPLKILTQNDEKKSRDAVQLEGNYNRIKADYKQGRIFYDQSQREEARITDAILSIISDQDLKDGYWSPVIPYVTSDSSYIYRNIIPIITTLIVGIFTYCNIAYHKNNNKPTIEPPKTDIKQEDNPTNSSTYISKDTIVEKDEPILSKYDKFNICEPCNSDTDKNKYYIIVSTTPSSQNANNLVKSLHSLGYNKAKKYTVEGCNYVYADICGSEDRPKLLANV